MTTERRPISPESDLKIIQEINLDDQFSRSSGIVIDFRVRNQSKAIHSGYVDSLFVVTDGLAIIEGYVKNLKTDTLGEVIVYGHVGSAEAHGPSRILIFGSLDHASVDSTGQIRVTEKIGEIQYPDEMPAGIIKQGYDVSGNTRILLEKLKR